MKPNNYRTDTTVNISKEKKRQMSDHIGRGKINAWVEAAIDEKIARERMQTAPVGNMAAQ